MQTTKHLVIFLRISIGNKRKSSYKISENELEATPDATPLAAYLDNLTISEEPAQNGSSRIISSHPEEMNIGQKDEPIRTRSFFRSSGT